MRGDPGDAGCAAAALLLPPCLPARPPPAVARLPPALTVTTQGCEYTPATAAARLEHAQLDASAIVLLVVGLLGVVLATVVWWARTSSDAYLARHHKQVRGGQEIP
eukprot:COSAG01_NODE_3940_length_5513_cov_18.497968_3_plen_106_part_00